MIVSGGGSNVYGGTINGTETSYVQGTTTVDFQGSVDRVFVATAETIPFEFEATGGVLVLGGLFTLHRMRKLEKS